MITIVSDIFDPSKGSEFQVPLVALGSVARCGIRPIRILTTKRADNESSIRNWLERNGLVEQVELELYNFRFADQLGNHSNKLMFLLDLIGFYIWVRAKAKSAAVVWKCGQLNVAFNLVYLLFVRTDILGPISGLEYPSVFSVPFVNWRYRLNYIVYNILILVARGVLPIALRLRKVKHAFCCTMTDVRALQGAWPGGVSHCLECDIRDITTKSDSHLNFDKSKLIIWAGVMVHRKNPLLAFYVLSAFLVDYPDYSVAMIGDGILFSEIESLRLKLPYHVARRFALLSMMPRNLFMRELARAKVLFVSSGREANSVLVLEALALNTRVVSACVSGMADTLNGTGWLYPLDKENTVAHARMALTRAISEGGTGSPESLILHLNRRLSSKVERVLSDLIL